MGRALYSQSYAPVIREPSPSQYEKWSISNPFDPDSEEFFKGAQYEAFLPMPTNSSTSNDGSAPPFRTPISATRATMTRDADQTLTSRASRVRISRQAHAGSEANLITFSSVPRDLPDMDAPSLPTIPPPVTMSDFIDADMETTRPAPSPMAADSDPEDPIRILAAFMNDYRASRNQGETEANPDVSEILRQLDERWRREVREAQSLSRENGNRPQRYLPPLSYPSSNASSSSSRADSPSSPIFFPSPPSETLPTPPPMSRELIVLPDSESSSDLAFHLDEDLERVERELLDFESRSQATETHSASLSDTSTMPTATVVSIPISQSQTPPRPIRIHHRTPSGFANESGLDMSPPPSVSPRLYNWSRTRPDSHPRYDSLSSSPANYGRRDEVPSVRSIPISEGRF